MSFFANTTTELHQILDWWMTRMPDTAHGGVYGRIDGQGELHPEAHKGVVLHARILWTFSAAARQTGNASYTAMATRAYEFILDHFLDRECGGVYWSVDYRGVPVNTKKQVYAQAFAVYALSEYYLLTGQEDSLEQALAIFDFLEKNTLDKVYNGYFEAYSREWVLLEDLRLSDIDANEAKSQNTHLHVLEGYANLLRALKAHGGLAAQHNLVSGALVNLVQLFLDKLIDPETSHIHLFFDEQWQVKSDIVSFGHDIEASWLIWDAAQTIGQAALITTVRPVCLKIAEVTLAEALDPDGAVINQRWNHSGRLDTDRIWWVQAEAMVGFWNAFEMSGDERYRLAALDCWDFTYTHMRDTAGGEWYWRISKTGEKFPEEDKAGFWKCPYHNGRAMMMLSNK